VKIPVALAVLISSGWFTSAQTNDVDVGDMLDAAQQFAQDNLDPDVLQALQQMDRAKVEDFLNHFEDYLKGNSVLDVAQLKDAANTILPLLEAHDETQPCAAWLRARLDYFDAADELNSLTPAPKPEPGTNTPPSLTNPSFKTEREIWIRKVSPSPWPKGADQFVPKLKTIFTAEGVPSALVWLGEVESGFDATARSPAGAVGMFQLMPATAKENGLSLFPFDQRKQMEPAAHAAAKNLRQLHDQFGDWRLAVAAYNSGAGTVQRLMKRHQTSSYEGIAPHLPAETQMYVPKVEATILHREGLELEKLKVPVPSVH
jgi:membrane-bound lytic murein transglycosylase D